jgi:hypothetical protein
VDEKEFSKLMQDYNAKFYQNLTWYDMESAAMVAGLDKGSDIKLAMQYFPLGKINPSILEVGGGYGRVVDFLLSKNCSDLTIIERDFKFAQQLTKKYQQKIAVVNSDILDWKTNTSFDVILLMWASFAEFSIEKQKQLLKNLSLILKQTGVLIIDSLRPSVIAENAIKANLQAIGELKAPDVTVNHSFVTVKIGNSCAYLYFPSLEKMRELQSELGFNINHQDYITDCNGKRIFFILQKN